MRRLPSQGCEQTDLRTDTSAGSPVDGDGVCVNSWRILAWLQMKQNVRHNNAVVLIKRCYRFLGSGKIEIEPTCSDCPPLAALLRFYCLLFASGDAQNPLSTSDVHA